MKILTGFAIVLSLAACKSREFNPTSSTESTNAANSSGLLFSCDKPVNEFRDSELGGDMKVFFTKVGDDFRTISSSTNLSINFTPSTVNVETGGIDKDYVSVSSNSRLLKPVGYSFFIDPTPVKWKRTYGCAVDIILRQNGNQWSVVVNGDINDKDCSATKAAMGADNKIDLETNKLYRYVTDHFLSITDKAQRQSAIDSYVAHEGYSAEAKQRLKSRLQRFDDENAEHKKKNEPLDTSLGVVSSSSVNASEILSFQACKSSLTL